MPPAKWTLRDLVSEAAADIAILWALGWEPYPVCAVCGVLCVGCCVWGPGRLGPSMLYPRIGRKRFRAEWAMCPGQAVWPAELPLPLPSLCARGSEGKAFGVQGRLLAWLLTPALP